MRKLVVVTPVFNDWKSFGMLVTDISEIAAEKGYKIHVIAVDDGSTQSLEEEHFDAPHLESINIVRLVCNMGHQRAIAIGLVEANRLGDIAGVVVMDSDGEDRPQDIAALVEDGADAPGFVVVASRAKRSEGFGFRFSYSIYKSAFRLLVGSRIDFGNFSFIPAGALNTLAHSAGIWNHLAASISRSNLPIRRRPCPRGKRYAGQSKMNFPSLLLHGLGAMSVYVDVVLVRMIIAIGIIMGLLAVAMVSVIAIKLTTGFAIPGWTSNVVGMLAILLLLSFLFVFTAVFQLLNLRSMRTVIPITDSQHYIDGQRNVPHTNADTANVTQQSDSND